jgi:hypothetical protein
MWCARQRGKDGTSGSPSPAVGGEIAMARKSNQRPLDVLQWLSDGTHGQDEAIRAWHESIDTVGAAECEAEDLEKQAQVALDTVIAQYETKLAASCAPGGAEAVRRRA